MNRRTWLNTGLLIAALLLSYTGIVTSNDASPCSSYEDVINRYFTALSSGDTTGLSKLLGEQYLLRKQAVLSSPSYGAYLRAQYGNASWQLLRCKQPRPGSIEIETQIRFPSQESRRIRFFLSRDPHSGDLKIEGEKDGVRQ